MSRELIINEFMATVAKAVAQLKIDLEAPTPARDDVFVHDAPAPVDPIRPGMTFSIENRTYTILQSGEEKIMCEYYFDAVDAAGFLAKRRQEVTINRAVVLAAIAPAPKVPTVGMKFFDGDLEINIDAIQDGKVHGVDNLGVAYIEDLDVVKVLL